MGSARRLGGLAVVLAALAASGGASAGDRPFLLGGTALQEDDDERVFEVGSGAARAGRARAYTGELQYSFAPWWSVELGWSRRLARNDQRETEREWSVEARYGWLDPARHPVGVALQAELERARESDVEGRGRWQLERTALTLPLTVQWATHRGQAALHLTPGVEHRHGEGRRPLLALAGQWPLLRSVELFGEWGAVRERQRFAQAGARWWIKRERFALDISVGRQRGGGEAVPMAALSLSLMDLSY
ncbi:hypothetical protein [Aquabacterium humicola]|uniref:hypothetical protein n=1 Tax=Aquabacterium humicola TaxID=3237377 RepID=UPI002542FCB3|nr:hypothetical protein [Rubrivivax pictus]